MKFINSIKTKYQNYKDRKKLAKLKRTVDACAMIYMEHSKQDSDVTIIKGMLTEAQDTYKRFKDTLPLTKEEEHKNFLIELYSTRIADKTETDFNRLVFQRGLRMVTAGRSPKSVENYVENLIKIWLYR